LERDRERKLKREGAGKRERGGEHFPEGPMLKAKKKKTK